MPENYKKRCLKFLIQTPSEIYLLFVYSTTTLKSIADGGSTAKSEFVT